MGLPVPAFKYKADNSDMVDMAMSWALCKLDAASSASLWLRRLAPTKYEIDGRRVTVCWQTPKRRTLVACEDDVPDGEVVPLLDYLQQAASVATDLRPVPMTPGRKRLTFRDNDEPSGFSEVGSERIRCMLD